MAAWTHYFTFSEGYWIEVIADSIKKAEIKIKEAHDIPWEHHYHSFLFLKKFKNYPKGCLAFYEAE